MYKHTKRGDGIDRYAKLNTNRLSITKLKICLILNLQRRNVPIFICEQQLRVRTKIHKIKNKKGFCKLSVMVACQPKNITELEKSEYSLDDLTKLPKNLIIL